MKLSRTTSLRRAGLAAAAALLLSSCAGTAPGVAAVVDGDRITDDEVDAFAEVLCAIGGVQGTEAGASAKAARLTSLQILMSDKLAAEVADVDAVPQQSVAAILQGMAPAREALSADLQDTFDTVAEEFARAQTAVVELGRKSLESSGTTGKDGQVADDAAYAEGQRLLAEHADGADIKVDPRFGKLVNGTLQPSNGSLSVPVSDLAVKGDSPEAGAELLSLLPASQKCASPS